MAVWLTLQIAVLALAAARVPLAANYPRPAESLAAHLLLAAQVAASALLFPFLMRDARAALAVAAAAVPMQLAAGSLAMLPARQLAPAAAYVILWLMTLAAWRLVLRSEWSQLIGTAVAASVALGGAALWYLGTEFGAAPPPAGAATRGAFGPLVAAVASLERGTVDLWAAASTGAVLLVALVIAALRARLRPPRRSTRRPVDAA